MNDGHAPEKSTTFHTICRILLRELRQERGIQQAQICQMLGRVSTSTWSKVESGDTPLTLEHLLTACSACQVWPSDLFVTAQNYMSLLQQNNWFVAGYGNPQAKEDDLLSQRADEFYSSHLSKIPSASWNRYPILQTPWPYPGMFAPIEVIRWTLEQSNINTAI